MANKRAAITGSLKLTKWDGSVMSGSTYTTALAMPSAAKEAPETNVATGLLGVDTQGRGRLDVTFSGTDAANETVNYQVIGYRHSQANGANGFIPEKIAAGAATLGTKTLGAAGAYIESSASFWADTITETLASGFALVHSPADNTMARLSIDVSPFIWATVQVERGTAATANIVANLCDWIGGLASFDADITLGNVGLLDTNAAAIDPAIKGNQLITPLMATLGKTFSDLVYTSIDIAAAGSVNIAAAAGGVPYLLALFGTTNTAGATITIREVTGSTVISGAMEFNENNGLVLPHTGMPYVWGDTGDGLNILATGGSFEGGAVTLTG